MKIDLATLSLPTEGRVYDLSSGWWRHMMPFGPHPQLEILSYRTPRGLRNQGDVDIFVAPENTSQTAIISDLVIGTTHTGTHVDALAHITCGPDHHWHGGDSADTMLGDFGPLGADASALAPIIGRGVMLDIPPLTGRRLLDAGEAVGPEQVTAALDRQKLELRPGDIVLLRTGQMSNWPDVEAIGANAGSGLSLAGAELLSAAGVAAVGADTEYLEVMPAGVPGTPLPVHLHLLLERGIPILEWVDCEQLAHDGVHEFLFVALPLTITGATGSMIRPVAIA
jgi:kynurenine formamidase